MTVALVLRLAANAATVPAPGTPTGLSAVRDNGYNRAVITWTDPVAVLTSITVERSYDNVTFADAGIVKPGVQFFRDGNLTKGVLVYYRVYASNLGGDSSPTSSVNITIYSPQTEMPSALLILESGYGLNQSSGGSAATIAGDPVGEWLDQSGSPRNFTQATGGNKPSLQFVNGAPVVRFSSDDFLSNAATWTSLNNGTAYSIFIVFRSTDNGNAPYAILGNCGIVSSTIGLLLLWDNRSSSSFAGAVRHLIPNGSSYGVNNSADGMLDDETWGVTEFIYGGHGVMVGFDSEVRQAGDTRFVNSSASPSASAPTYNLHLGDAGEGSFPANIDIAAIYISQSQLAASDRQLLREYIASQYPTLLGHQADHFLTARQIESSSVKARTILTLAKSGSNPIFSGGTWDFNHDYGSVIKIGSTYYLWYWGIDSSGVSALCYATSSDGISWTRPNLGLKTYGGNTNNNIFMLLHEGTTVIYNPSNEDPAYLYMLYDAGDGGGTYGSNIQHSADGLTWVDNGFFFSGGAGDNLNEAHSLARNPNNGHYLAYATRYHASETRRIEAWRLSRSRYGGSWYDVGVVINTSLSTEQKYNLNVFTSDGIFYALVDIYDNSADEIYRTDLYCGGANGLEWELIQTGVLVKGGSGAFDEHMILSYTGVTEVGNNWYLYYFGSSHFHSFGVGAGYKMGLATLPAKRFGGYQGTGEVTTQPLYLLPSQSVYVNADASLGDLKAEVLDSSGSVISGYSAADFTVISTDTYSTQLMWGDTVAPQGQLIRIRFVLRNTSLFAWNVAAGVTHRHLIDAGSNRLTDANGDELTE